MPKGSQDQRNETRPRLARPPRRRNCRRAAAQPLGHGVAIFCPLSAQSPRGGPHPRASSFESFERFSVVISNSADQKRRWPSWARRMSQLGGTRTWQEVLRVAVCRSRKVELLMSLTAASSAQVARGAVGAGFRPAGAGTANDLERRQRLQSPALLVRLHDVTPLKRTTRPTNEPRHTWTRNIIPTRRTSATQSRGGPGCRLPGRTAASAHACGRPLRRHRDARALRSVARAGPASGRCRSARAGWSRARRLR